jgi:hypothetical protein
MSKPNESPTAPSGDDRQLLSADQSVAAPDFEEHVRKFWEKNRSLLLLVTAVVLLSILGQYAWTWMQAGKISAQREAYGAVSTDAERQVFASEHSGSSLGGIALLEVADAAFKDGRYQDAITAYDAAAEALSDSVLISRIRLGRAMSQVHKGDSAGGQSALRDVANDLGATRAVRSEAAYHLASIATAAGDSAALSALVTQITSIDPASQWAQRIALLQASMPVVASTDETSAAVSFPTP